MDTKIEFKLHEKQIEVWEHPARYKVLVTGRRFGKTILAVITLIIKALSQNGSNTWFVAPSYRQAKMIAWRMFKNYAKDLPFDVKFNEAELSLQFPNGSLIELKGADNEDALRGTGLDGMVIDEFAAIYNNWSVWHEVLRPMLTDKRGWVMFIGTPKGKDALHELFLKGQREEDGYASWQFKTVDNPFIDPQEVEDAKRTMPERYFRQEYEGSFEDYVGLVYPEFSDKHHIVEPFPIPDHWQRIASIDPATSGTTAVLWCAVDEHENLYFYDELYERDWRVSQVADAIKDRGKVDYWLIDPASQARNQTKEGRLYSLFDEYGDFGLYPTAGENDVDAGINRVAELLKQDRIKIFSTLKWLPWELKRYHWAEVQETVKGMAKPVPYKKDDHLTDDLRYICMSRPGASKGRPKEKPPYWSPAYQDQLGEREGAVWEKRFI